MNDFFQEFLKSSQSSKRFRRDADLADLGDKLTEKLQVAMKKWNAKMSNMSCYLKEVKWVDSNMNLDKNLLMADLDNYKWDDQWLLQKSKDDTNKCFAVAQSIPKFVAEDFYSEKWGRIKMFHFCMKKHQAYTCMKYDVKKMLEKHFGQLGDLVEQTDIEENMLLDLVHGILEDSMGHSTTGLKGIPPRGDHLLSVFTNSVLYLHAVLSISGILGYGWFWLTSLKYKW